MSGWPALHRVRFTVVLADRNREIGGYAFRARLAGGSTRMLVVHRPEGSPEIWKVSDFATGYAALGTLARSGAFGVGAAAFRSVKAALLQVARAAASGLHAADFAGRMRLHCIPAINAAPEHLRWMQADDHG